MSNMTSEQDSLWLVGVYSAAEVLTAVVACVGNGLVCWVFARTPVPWAPTHYFVASQAAADAGVGCLAVPFSVALGFQVELDRHVCRFLVVFILLLTQTSIFSLLAIAVDRSLFIRVPLRYADLVRPSRVKVIIAALWLLSFFIILLPYLLWPRASPQHGAAATFGPCVFEEAMDMRFMVYCVFLGCVLPPLLLMLLLYSRIFAVARQHLEQEQRGRGDGASSLLSRELRAARPLAAAVGVSYVCWLPLHIRNGLTLLHPPLRAPNWLTLAAIALSHANSAFNPLLYALKLTEFRRALRTTLWPQKPWTRGDAALNSHHDCILATCAGSRNTLDTQGHGATHPSSA
ncbi:adenosine receptor A2b-like isoform X2 [Scleropages formosus]|nr:adenosine receptor A2b-like isoform X2 [Scleropages formosus]